MKTMKTKKVAWLLILTLFCTCFFACSQQPEPVAPDETEDLPQEENTDLFSMSWEEIESQAKEEGLLSLWIWSSESEYKQLAEQFEEEYGVKVSFMISDKNTALNKVLVEKDGEVGSIDCMFLPGDTINTIMASDVLYGKVLDKMPNADDLDPVLCERNEGVQSNHVWVPFYMNYTGMLYDSSKVSEDDLPQTWEDLENWIDANPGKCAFCIPEKGGSGQAFMQTIITNLTGYDAYFEDPVNLNEDLLSQWDIVWKWINDRKDKIVFTTSNTDSINRINQGECYMTVAWDSNVTILRKSGDIISTAKLYIPEFGLVYGGDVYSMLKNAPHPAAAMLWLRYACSEEAQLKMIEVLGNYPANKAVTMPTESTNLSPEDITFSVEWIPAIYKAEYIDQFTKNVLMN